MTKTVEHVGDRYLRFRPFLVVEVTSKTAKGIRTEKNDWAHDAKNWDTFETATITDRISTKDLYKAAIIIDIVNKTVIKNRYGDKSDDAKAVEDYMKRYHNKVMEGLNVWNAQQKFRSDR